MPIEGPVCPECHSETMVDDATGHQIAECSACGWTYDYGPVVTATARAKAPPRLPPEVVEMFDEADRLKAAGSGGIIYVVELRWTRCKAVDRKLFRYRKRAERWVETKADKGSQFHWSRSWRKAHPDEYVLVVDVYERIRELEDARKIACACCGEMFLPSRPNQRYVDGTHRLRAFRARRTDFTEDNRETVSVPV